MSESTDSPFKFLDAFQREDVDLYFGREQEVEDIYELTFDTKLIVFFGASGTGKTSLVQCGLANKFPPARWQELYIRRGGDINESLLSQINDALEKEGSGPATDPMQALLQLDTVSHTPAYLIFDQFEELFILQPDEAEKEAFFSFLQRFLETRVFAKAILVMREEFIAHLWDWEHLAPSLFNHRYRIASLEEKTLLAIVESTIALLEAKGKLQAEEPARMAQLIWKNLSKGESGPSLTNLQIFLDRLYRKAVEKDQENPLFSPALVGSMKNIDDLFDDFLEEELHNLEQTLGPGREGVPIRLLAAFVSDEQTKKVLELDSLDSLREKYQLTKEELLSCLTVFEDKLRLLKSYES